MLKDGYHQSFSELFNLIVQQKCERDHLGPDSGLSDRPLLEDEPDKLDKLKLHLTTAEAAKRRGKNTAVSLNPLSRPTKIINSCKLDLTSKCNNVNL
jgi:hypothetical protein